MKQLFHFIILLPILIALSFSGHTKESDRQDYENSEQGCIVCLK